MSKQLSPIAAIVVILITVSIVVVTGYFVFIHPHGTRSQQEAASVEAIIDQAVAREREGDTALCLVKAASAEWCAGQGYTYLALDCEVLIRPLKGTADKIVTSPPGKDDTYRQRITLLSGGKDIGHVDIPQTYNYNDQEWRVRDVYVRAFTTPAK